MDGMDRMMMPIDVIQHYKKLCKEIKEVQRETLNEWEISFVQTIHCRVKNGLDLTERQIDKLEEIYQKVCDSPH